MQLVRLKGLLVTLLVVAVGGWIWLDEYLVPAYYRLLEDLIYLWDNATLAAIVRGLAAWISRYSWRVILIEAVKRALIWLAINRFIVWLLPWRWRVQFRWWVREKRASFASKIRRTRAFLSREDMFGPYFGYAIWGLVTLIVVVFFYSFFWLWTMIVLGFIKLPAIMNYWGRWLWRRISWVLEKTGVRKLLIRLFKTMTGSFVRFLPNWSIFSQDEEAHRRRRVEQIRQIRELIKLRKNKELWWQARGRRSVYRQLRDELGHDINYRALLPGWMLRLGKRRQTELQTSGERPRELSSPAE